MDFSILKNKKAKTVCYLQFLKKVSIFKNLDENILVEIVQMLEEIVLPKGSEVFAKGDSQGALYLIMEGSVVVHDGEHIFASFGADEFFGEYSLIDSTSRSATVTTLKDTHLVRLEQSQFAELQAKYNEINQGILNILISRLRRNNILEEKLTQHSSKIQEQRDELEEQRKTLTELNATKDKFFTIIAHDLKNPFNTVIGLSDLLLCRMDSYDNEKIKEFVNQINKYANNAYALLENLLQWAKTQTGRIEMFPVSFFMQEVVDAVVDLYRAQAQEKEIRLHLDLKQARVYADANMVSTILRNLLSNAIKFTPKGGEVKIYANDIHNGHISFTVEDNGVGMLPEELEMLFKIDSHFTTPGTDEETGTGIGLILAKEFIEKNQGTLQVESKKEVGTKFTFQLPLAQKM